MDKIDIYNYAHLLDRAVMAVSNPVSTRNTETILEFEKYCFAEGLSKPRVIKYMRTLKMIAEFLEKNFDEATRKDIETVLYKVETSEYSPWTKRDYKVTLKKFYQWLRGCDKNAHEYPDEVKWMKTTIKDKDLLLPDQLLTEDELMKLVNAAENPRDKAFIITLYESGARIGELGSLRIRDLSFKENHAVLMLHGKTGARRIPVVASVPQLATWIENHPLKSNPDAPLWINLGTANKYQAMSYPALAKIVKTVAKRAGIKKKITLHRLRHSRATFLASRLTEAQMSQVFGWRQGSKMPSVYVHLSGRDIDDALLGVYGLRKEEQKVSELAPKECPRCKNSNSAVAKFCSKCGLVLDPKMATMIQEEADEDRKELEERVERMERLIEELERERQAKTRS